MLSVKILGTGCSKCRKLERLATQAISQAAIEARIEKVEDIDGIMAYGVMSTPALVIDEQVKSVGRLPSAAQITTWLFDAA